MSKNENANYEEAGGKNVIVNVKRLKYDFTECMPFNAVKKLRASKSDIGGLVTVRTIFMP